MKLHFGRSAHLHQLRSSVTSGVFCTSIIGQPEPLAFFVVVLVCDGDVPRESMFVTKYLERNEAGSRPSSTRDV